MGIAIASSFEKIATAFPLNLANNSHQALPARSGKASQVYKSYLLAHFGETEQ